MANRAVAKYLYKSRNYLVYINGWNFGAEITIKYRKAYGWFSSKFKWAECAGIWVNHKNSPGLCLGHKYQMMNFKDIHADPIFVNDLRDLNKHIGEEVFNDESILKYETYMVAERLRRSK